MGKGEGSGSQDSEIQGNHLIRSLHVETGLDMIVGSFLIAGQLVAAIGQAEHPQAAVEPLCVRAMLPFHLAVVPRRGDPDPLIFDTHVQ